MSERVSDGELLVAAKYLEWCKKQNKPTVLEGDDQDLVFSCLVELRERRAQRCETCYFLAMYAECPIRDIWESWAEDYVMMKPAESFGCARWMDITDEDRELIEGIRDAEEAAQ